MFGLTAVQSKAIIDWVKTELAMPVFASGEEGDRPERPFAVVHMKDGPQAETLMPTKSRNPGSVSAPVVLPSVDVIFYEAFLLSVVIRDTKDAVKYSRALERSLDKTAVKTALKAVGLYYRYCANTASAEHKLSTIMERVAFIDFKFAVTSSFNETRDVIEHVEISKI